MKRGGAGVDYIRKTVDKSVIIACLTRLEAFALTFDEPSGLHSRDAGRGMRVVIDSLESELNLLEGHPSRGWW